MPLELGADLALRLKGSVTQQRRRTLILDTLPHRDDVTLSDISGQDIAAHAGDPVEAIARVRDWLNDHRGPTIAPLPGGRAIAADYAAYLKLAPDIIDEARLDSIEELSHRDFLYTVDGTLPLIEAKRIAATT